jgi:hypothetical protein
MPVQLATLDPAAMAQLRDAMRRVAALHPVRTAKAAPVRAACSAPARPNPTAERHRAPVTEPVI